jgi:trans-aconitate 2-methyltransferase
LPPRFRRPRRSYDHRAPHQARPPAHSPQAGHRRGRLALTPLDWDAATYDRVADPQEAWAREIIARLDPRGDEVVLDAGCGSGRVTQLLLERLPQGRVIAVDASPAMVARAGERLARAGERAQVRCEDLLELRLPERVDAVFSCAVFHHVHDHERLFARLHAALRTGGRLVAQCGGEGNIAHFRAIADEVAARPPYAEHLAAMPAPWHYATVAETEARLRATGFAEIRCSTEAKPTIPSDARAFAGSVLLNYHLERLRERLSAEEARELGGAFVEDVLAHAGEPLELRYVRLNIEATAA